MSAAQKVPAGAGGNLASTLLAAHTRQNEAEERAASRAQAAGRRAIASTAGEFAQETFENVQVDAMVVMKIVRHARQAAAQQSAQSASLPVCAGQLLGLDLSGSLHVSDTFAFPAGHVFPASDSAEDSRNDRSGDSKRRDESFDHAASNAATFTAQILPRLAELNADANVVGFYATTSNGQLAGPAGGLVEALARYQLGPGAMEGTAGVRARARASAEKRGPGRGVALVYDASSSNTATIKLRAFRLTDAFLNVFKSGQYDAQSLAENSILPANILREYPVTITRSSMLSALLSSLPAEVPAAVQTLGLPSTATAAPGSVSQPLQALLSSFDASVSALSNMRWVDRRSGKSNPTSTQLDVIKALGAADGAATNLQEGSGLAVARLFGAKAAAST